MTNIEHLDNLTSFLENQGVDVILFSDLPSDILGRYYSDTELIKLNCKSCFTTLLVLTHEAGHWLSYQRRRDMIFEPTLRRELFAYLYGWAIVKYLNLPISKDLWKHIEYENLTLYGWPETSTSRATDPSRPASNS